MKLTKFEYSSAIYFGVLSLAISLFSGLVTYIDYKLGNNLLVASPSLLNLFIVGPVIGGVMVYFYFLIAIFLYNNLAKKYPITWEVKK